MQYIKSLQKFIPQILFMNTVQILLIFSFSLYSAFSLRIPGDFFYIKFCSR